MLKTIRKGLVKCRENCWTGIKIIHAVVWCRSGSNMHRWVKCARSKKSVKTKEFPSNGIKGQGQMRPFCWKKWRQKTMSTLFSLIKKTRCHFCSYWRKRFSQQVGTLVSLQGFDLGFNCQVFQNGRDDHEKATWNEILLAPLPFCASTVIQRLLQKTFQKERSPRVVWNHQRIVITQSYFVKGKNLCHITDSIIRITSIDTNLLLQVLLLE